MSYRRLFSCYFSLLQQCSATRRGAIDALQESQNRLPKAARQCSPAKSHAAVESSAAKVV